MPVIKQSLGLGFLTQYFTAHEERKYSPSAASQPPPISTWTAVGLLTLYTLAYVLPFYLSPKTRPSATLSRDAPSVIRARITSVSLTCIVCSAATFVILTSKGHASTADAIHSLGYWPVGLFDTFKSLLLTALLFAGPLFEYFVAQEGWRDWRGLTPVSEVCNEWTAWRNIIAGPVTEEVLFRSAAVPLMLLAQTSVTKTIFLSPLVFGLAHLHHFYEFRISHPQVPASSALARSLFQLAFTTVFGAYETFLFLRTGSLLAICAVHAFCNAIGLPRFWGRVETARPSTSWTVVYYVLLFAGAALWWSYLGRLTQSPNELVPVNV